ncbi:MAG: hypothetical protein K5641_00930 [Lachnospiraceae bacterium]|nr:hypothetical protein [Lachnospiraceae bacterium]
MKRSIIFSCIVTALILMGCGRSLPLIPSDDTDASVIEVKKDGSVFCHVEGAFKEDYYDKDSLETFVKSEVEDYNRAHKDAVSIDSVSVSKERATIELEFATAADYGVFEAKEFYMGTVDSAKQDGYRFDVPLFSPSETGKALTGDELNELGGKKVVICEEGMAIMLSDDVICMSEGVTLIDKSTVTTPGDRVSYIVYK